jgi:TPR repeat protein
MREITFSKGRTAAAIALLTLGGVMLWLAIGLPSKELSPIPSNRIEAEKLKELQQKAKAGDAVALYALTLYAEDANQSEQLLQKAADAGYPPAMVTYAQSLMQKNGVMTATAKTMLEGAGRQGYYPAIVELAQCINAGECDELPKADAYMWIAVANILAQQSKIENIPLNEVEQRLRLQLTASELARALADAKALAERALKQV